MNNKQPPQPQANVEEIHYKARGRDGKLWLDEVVNLNDPSCPFSKKIQGCVATRECSLRNSVNQVKGKPTLTPAHCFPRIYITHFHDCPAYKEGTK